MRTVRFVVVLVSILCPVIASAQSSLAGAVRDSSGAVLPGVTVEAASPALIEKVRSVVTDATGQYKIVDLRPGTYTITFSLTGFSVVKREGIELAGGVCVIGRAARFAAACSSIPPGGSMQTRGTRASRT